MGSQQLKFRLLRSSGLDQRPMGIFRIAYSGTRRQERQVAFQQFCEGYAVVKNLVARKFCGHLLLFLENLGFQSHTQISYKNIVRQSNIIQCRWSVKTSLPSYCELMNLPPTHNKRVDPTIFSPRQKTLYCLPQLWWCANVRKKHHKSKPPQFHYNSN